MIQVAPMAKLKAGFFRASLKKIKNFSPDDKI